MNIDQLRTNLAAFTGLEDYADSTVGQFSRFDPIVRDAETFRTPDDFDPETAPFADFFGQATFWRERGGRVWALDDMEPSHIQNLFRFLTRNMSGIVFAAASPFERMAPLIGGEMASLDLENVIGEIYDADPKNSILMRDLAARVVAIRRRSQADRIAELF